MLRRLALALLKGPVIGLALGVGAARWLGLRALGGPSQLLLGAAAGFLVGLVAGRPIWARDGKTEALLKAVAGALAGAGLSFAAGRWLTPAVDLSAFQLGVGPLGQLSAAVLPLVATVLALFFELDNNGPSQPKARVASARTKQRLPSSSSHATKLNELDLEEPADTEQRRGKH